MAASLVGLVHGRNLTERQARALMDGARAAYPRSRSVGQPAQPVSTSRATDLIPSTDPLLPVGLVRATHRGEWPHLTACTCACHGNGDTSGASCDERSC
jgi:hypothetical protein